MTKSLLLVAGLVLWWSAAVAEPLESWNDGVAKARIMSFVETVTQEGGPDYVAPEDRIAVFDNDGTLWAEQPLYFQLLFAMDYLAERGAADPSILSTDILKAAAVGDVETVLGGGHAALNEVMTVSHSGMSVEEFTRAARAWLDTTPHPTTNQPFISHIYQPMLELLAYLRNEGFETYIVTGGGIHFVRSFSDDVYGIPPENVVGSMGGAEYRVVDGVPEIVKLPDVFFVDDKQGKPVGIDRAIGRRPILAFGNSDGDFEMLEWTSTGDGPRLAALIHHTDADREWAYDRDSHIGRLVRGLDEGADRNWLIVNMDAAWTQIFPGDE